MLKFFKSKSDYSSVPEKLKEVERNSGFFTFQNIRRPVAIQELTNQETIGYGTFGTVTKRWYKDTPIAVKSLTRTGDNETMFRALMDLDVIKKSIDCPEIVKCYGYFVTDLEVLICMEYMDTCLDRLLKKLGAPIPENIIGKINYSVVKALRYLKDKHKIIHRDVKPPNLLLNKNGEVKLCDFGISRQLVESVAHSLQGCKPYMAPERLSKPGKPYGIQSDVWSLGVTLVELANGQHPYDAGKSKHCEMLAKVMLGAPPRLELSRFSEEFCDFVEKCLQKERDHRPKYNVLSQHPFVTGHRNGESEVQEWIARVL